MDGCESHHDCNGIHVHGATCTHCADDHTCTQVRCDRGLFDSNGDAGDGCESHYDCSNIHLLDGSCSACSDESTCTTIASCDQGHFDSDGDPATGCESIHDCKLIYVPHAVCTGCADNIRCTALSACAHGHYDSNADAIDGCESDFDCHNMFDVHNGRCTSCTYDRCQTLKCDDHYTNANDVVHDGCEIGPRVPVEASAHLNDEYDRLAYEWRELTFTKECLTSSICLLAYEDDCEKWPRNRMHVQVHTPPALGVKGCASLIPFYNAVRDSQIPQIAKSIQILQDKTSQQMYVSTLRESIENMQNDAYKVQMYCNDLATALKIKRNVFHAYVDSWSKMKFGDNLIPDT